MWREASFGIRRVPRKARVVRRDDNNGVEKRHLGGEIEYITRRGTTFSWPYVWVCVCLCNGKSDLRSFQIRYDIQQKIKVEESLMSHKIPVNSSRCLFSSDAECSVSSLSRRKRSNLLTYIRRWTHITEDSHRL